MVVVLKVSMELTLNFLIQVLPQRTLLGMFPPLRISSITTTVVGISTPVVLLMKD